MEPQGPSRNREEEWEGKDAAFTSPPSYRTFKAAGAAAAWVQVTATTTTTTIIRYHPEQQQGPASLMASVN